MFGRVRAGHLSDVTFYSCTSSTHALCCRQQDWLCGDCRSVPLSAPPLLKYQNFRRVSSPFEGLVAAGGGSRSRPKSSELGPLDCAKPRRAQKRRPGHKQNAASCSLRWSGRVSSSRSSRRWRDGHGKHREPQVEPREHEPGGRQLVRKAARGRWRRPRTPPLPLQLQLQPAERSSAEPHRPALESRRLAAATWRRWDGSSSAARTWSATEPSPWSSKADTER